MAWHNLTIVKPFILLRDCWLSAWDVVKAAMTEPDGSKSEYCRVVCTDNKSITIGKPVHEETYTLLNNATFLSLVQSALDQIRGASVASVGSVCRRARVFVSLKLPALESLASETLTLTAAGRTFQFYLSFFNSHDKSAPFGVQLSTVCVVCNNTFNAVLQCADGKLLRLRIPHTKNMEAKLADVPRIIDAFFTSAQQFAEQMNALAMIPITAADAKNFFAGFLVTGSDGSESEKSESDQVEISTRRMNQIDRLVSLFVSGKGNNGANLADLFSAVTDYYSHESSGGDDKVKQIASSEFGNGQTMKSLCWAILKDDKRIAATIADGNRILAANAAK